MRQRRLPLLVLVAFTAFGAGGLCNASMGTAWAAGYRKLDVFAKVLAYVENSYVDDIDGNQLVYGAIKGMLSVLDPYTVFLPPEELAEMRSDTAGEFGGLGVELSAGDGGGLVVVAPLDDTPAARAGIVAKDRILAIDGEATREMSLHDAVMRLRGAPGSKVKLTIMREGFTAPRELALQRDRVRVQSVEARLYPGGYGYVKVKSFQERTDAALAKALNGLRTENDGAELQGLVLDLRNNPGGLLEQGVRVADRFLSSGVIVSTEGRGGKLLDVERAHAPGTEADYPLIVLVNGGSASASEIVAGALQDHGRGVIMGTQTFGKGSVQTVIDLEDGSGLKMTIARYYTPKHRSIHGKGVAPDVVVAEEEAAAKDAPRPIAPLERDAPPPNVASSSEDRLPPVAPPTARPDGQLRAALDTLQGWETFQAQRALPKVETAVLDD